MQPAYFPNADITLLKVYDMPVIERAFSSIANDWEIEFNFPQGGCQQRAQIMSMILQKKFNIEHCKIWLFSPAALYLNDTRTFYTEDKNRLSPDNKVEWNYHVAPVVQVQSGNTIDTLVIDPSTNRNAAVPVEQWFSIIGNSSAGKYSFLLPDKYFFNCTYHTHENNQVTTLFDGSFFDFENPAKDNLAMEKGLAINDMVMKIYHKYIQPLMMDDNTANAAKLEDLKAVFGNSTALDLLFSQNISAYTDNTTHRYVITHYSDIIKEAKEIFNERLFFWTNFVNTLL